MRILLIANARRNGGLSGSDAIYEAFVKHWDCSTQVQTMPDIDYKPFLLCYIHRIIWSCLIALFDFKRYDLVYSCSDFWMDSLPGFIYKLKGAKWVAGFYLKSTKENKAYYYSQVVAENIIRNSADMVIVTNPTMYKLFPDKRKTWINGVIHLDEAQGDRQRIFDAVFCGRIHPTKGIDELIEIWKAVRIKNKNAKLAVIGDGDLGARYMMEQMPNKFYGVYYFGFMGKDRYRILKESKVFLYTTPFKHDHFSIAPVEAMACGCPIIAFDTPVIRFFEKHLGLMGGAACPNINSYAEMVLSFIDGEWKEHSEDAREWARQFDEKAQALRVLSDIRKELFNADFRNWA